jgi:hypothetical protein
LFGGEVDFLGMFEVGKTYQLPHGPPPPYLPGDVVGALVVNTLFGPLEVEAQWAITTMGSSSSRLAESSDLGHHGCTTDSLGG